MELGGYVAWSAISGAGTDLNRGPGRDEGRLPSTQARPPRVPGSGMAPVPPRRLLAGPRGSEPPRALPLPRHRTQVFLGFLDFPRRNGTADIALADRAARGQRHANRRRTDQREGRFSGRPGQRLQGGPVMGIGEEC